MNGSPKVLNVVHARVRTHTHTHTHINKKILFMSRGPVSVQMLAGNQRIPGAELFLHLSLVCNNCQHQNWHPTTTVRLLQVNRDQNTCQKIWGRSNKMALFVYPESPLQKSQPFSLGKHCLKG